jgi:hypothetical protein
VRRALLSVAVALAGAAGVTVSGWALQAAALPPPVPADRVAADASVWLHEYRLVVDVFHVDHRRMKGACLRGWFPFPNRSIRRASRLSLKSGPVPHLSRLTRDSLALGGCSGKLLSFIAIAAQSGDRLTTERSYAAGRPAIALELDRGREERLTLYVSPRTYKPLVAFVALDGEEATARLYLHRITPHLLRRFRLPHEANPRPRR